MSKAERKQVQLPVALRWAVLKAADGTLTKKQAAALAELEAGDVLTAVAWRIKEKLRWVRRAETPHAARWRLSHFLRHAREQIGEAHSSKPSERLWRRSRRTATASWSAGPRATPTPDWRP